MIPWTEIHNPIGVLQRNTGTPPQHKHPLVIGLIHPFVTGELKPLEAINSSLHVSADATTWVDSSPGGGHGVASRLASPPGRWSRSPQRRPMSNPQDRAN